MYSTECPTYLPDVPKVIIIGDVHGDLGRLATVLRALGVINQNLQWTAQPANTVVVQLGDQVDSAQRTPSEQHKNWEQVCDTDVLLFMDRLDGIARLKGGRVLSLVGNHELMNIMGEFIYVSQKSMQLSGGPEARRRQFATQGTMCELLANRCVVLKIGRLLFCHGGLLPQHLNVVDNNLHAINEVYRKLIRTPNLLVPDDLPRLHELLLSPEGILWTRKYMELMSRQNQAELCEVVTDVLKRTDTDAIFTGHNTVSEVSYACDGHLWLTDAMFSRAYGEERVQVVQAIHDPVDHGYKFSITTLKFEGGA